MFNDIHVTTSDVVVDGYKEYIGVRFERINANDTLDYAEIIMPDRKIISFNGFNECDLNWIMSFAIDNLLLMWQMAQADAAEHNPSHTEPNPDTIAALYKTHNDLSIGYCAQIAGMTKEDFINNQNTENRKD